MTRRVSGDGAVFFRPTDLPRTRSKAVPKTITSALGTYHLEALQQLRTNDAHVLSLSNLPGLVTFPSFHSAMEVIGIYCCRAKLPFFVLAVVVSGTMIASTPL
jgi:hypothetical protein